MNENEVRRGAGIYTKPVLSAYDIVVIKLSNSYAWRCPSTTMLRQYDIHLGRRHLDVGPGSGWYLGRAALPTDAEITLMDLNPNSLDSAARVLGDRPHRQLIGNVLEPLPETAGPYDSIATNYLFHCVPGTWAEKGVAFGHLGARLSDDGTLFGATILGAGVPHNLPGRALMKLYNRLGVFHNLADDEAGLRAALEQHFADVDVEVVGTVALFAARRPRR